MNQHRKQLLLIEAVLLVTLALSWNFYFKTATAQDTVDITNFPKVIGTWVSEDVPIPPADVAMLETKNAFLRRYTNTADGAEVHLFLVYSQHNRKVAHPPEIAYLGNGVSIIQNVHDPIKVGYKSLTIPTNRLKLIHQNFDRVSFYWFKIGEKFTSNYWEQQILVALSIVRGSTVGSALIRISADVLNGDQEKTIQNLKSFANLVTPELFLYLP